MKEKPIPRTASRNISCHTLHPKTLAVTFCIQKHQLSHSASKNVISFTLHDPQTSALLLCIQKLQLSHSASKNTSLFCIQKHQLALHPKTSAHSVSRNISSLTQHPKTSVLSLCIQKCPLSPSLMYWYHLCKALFVNPNEQKLKQDANLDYPNPHTTTVLRDSDPDHHSKKAEASTWPHLFLSHSGGKI